MNVNKLIENIDLRFKSGNAIPVERAHITATEWSQLKEIIMSLGNIAAGNCEDITDVDD